jgi:hypothetical protein
MICHPSQSAPALSLDHYSCGRICHWRKKQVPQPPHALSTPPHPKSTCTHAPCLHTHAGACMQMYACRQTPTCTSVCRHMEGRNPSSPPPPPHTDTNLHLGPSSSGDLGMYGQEPVHCHSGRVGVAMPSAFFTRRSWVQRLPWV